MLANLAHLGKYIDEFTNPMQDLEADIPVPPQFAPVPARGMGKDNSSVCPYPSLRAPPPQIFSLLSAVKAIYLMDDVVSLVPNNVDLPRNHLARIVYHLTQRPVYESALPLLFSRPTVLCASIFAGLTSFNPLSGGNPRGQGPDDFQPTAKMADYRTQSNYCVELERKLASDWVRGRQSNDVLPNLNKKIRK